MEVKRFFIGLPWQPEFSIGWDFCGILEKYLMRNISIKFDPIWLSCSGTWRRCIFEEIAETRLSPWKQVFISNNILGFLRRWLSQPLGKYIEIFSVLLRFSAKISTTEIVFNKLKQLYALYTIYGIIHAFPNGSLENTDWHAIDVLVLLYRKKQ